MSILFLKIYEVTRVISVSLFKGYVKLNKAQKLEWNNRSLLFPLSYSFSHLIYMFYNLTIAALLSRGISTFHALFVAVASVYILIVSDLFKEGPENELITHRTSIISDTALGVRC